MGMLPRVALWACSAVITGGRRRKEDELSVPADALEPNHSKKEFLGSSASTQYRHMYYVNVLKAVAGGSGLLTICRMVGGPLKGCERQIGISH